MATEMYCTSCGTIATPKTVTPGSFGMEVLLWLLLLLPGLLYSLWRLTARHTACPACGSATLIPPTSPKAQEQFGTRQHDGLRPPTPAGAASPSTSAADDRSRRILFGVALGVILIVLWILVGPQSAPR